MSPAHPVEQTLWADDDLTLRRCARDGSGPVLVLTTVSPYPSSEVVTRLEHAFAMRADLDPSWAVLPRALEALEGRPALVLDDPGGDLLAAHIGRRRELAAFLNLAIGLATSVRKLHECRLVHKDVRPSNLFADVATGRVWLGGFGIVSRPPPFGAAVTPDFLEGSAAYTAPEQSGRVNRAVDQRSDLYSVGVTLYELASGVLPFTAKTPADWIYAHVARAPAPLDDGTGAIPAQLAALIMKLLAKTPEERYQTAAGLEADLRTCLAHWETHGRIDPFLLAARDVPHRPKKPQRIYGRATELEALVNAHNRVAMTGMPELVVVSGRSGSGKSALIGELVKGLSPEGSLLASGKFDRFKQDIPYATVARALKDLVHHILRKSDAEIGIYRSALKEAFGDRGQLLVDLVPELSLLVGPTDPVPEVSPEEAKVRFRRLILRMFSALARPELPLVLFLDDLQWVDPATLELLQDLTKDGDARHLLLLGAYRDDEVGEGHPLARAVAELRANGVMVLEIVLGPLLDGEVTQLVADALRLSPSEARPLAEAILAKTGGNPFFLVEFLMALADDGFLAWDTGAATWRWDLPRIHAKAFTDSIVDLMIAKLKRLPEVTREALKLLASLGHVAETSALTLVSGKPEEALHQLLSPAEADGLIVRRGTQYKFLHDRVQEAAYALIPAEERAATQLRVARLLFSGLRAEEREQWLFEVTTHFVRGASLIESPRERVEVAELTLAAARRARAATAYSAAASYLTSGAALLPADCWETSYELAFAIGLLHAECQLLNGEPLAAEARLTRLAARAANPIDLSRVTCRRADVYLALDRHRESLDVCIEHLHRVGFALPTRPTDVDRRDEYDRLQRAIAGRSVESLVELPTMDAPESLAIMDVLMALLPSAELLGDSVREVAVVRMANLSIERGHCEPSTVAFAELSRALVERLGDREVALSFGMMALALVDRHGHPRARGRVYHIVGRHVLPWVEHVTKARTLMRRAYDIASDAGDIAFAAFSLIHLVSLSLATGEALELTQQQIEEALVFGRKNGVTLLTPYMLKMRRLIEELRGVRSEEPPAPELAEELTVPIARCWLWLRRLSRCVVERDDGGALEALAAAEGMLLSDRTYYEWAEYRYFAALAQAAAGNVASVIVHHAELATWAAACPANFASRAALVGAEIARLEGRPLDAEQLYEEAIDAAHANGFLQEEALANERAADFYAARRLSHCSRAFRGSARAAYLRWGANPKGQALEQGMRATAAPHGVAPATSAERFDLATVLEMSKAVSSEIVLDRLVERLVGIALEHAGATRGLLVLRTRDGHRTEAEAVAGSSRVTVRMVHAPVSAADLPETLFRYVLRTRQMVSLDDASTPGPFASDSYFAARHARAVLCLPLLKQTELIGVLYLENDLTSHAFTSDRIAILNVLASQAAISLENARLYAELKQADLHLAEAQALSHTGSFAWNLGDDSVAWSDEARKIYGFSKDTKQTGADVVRIIHPEDRGRTVQLVEAVSNADRDTFVNEFRIITSDGTLKHVRTVGHAVQGDSGTEMVGAILDITAAKRAEAELQRAHLLLAGAQRLSHTGSFGWNMETGEAYWSEETYAIYGVEPGTKASPERVLQGIHAEDVERVTRQVEHVVSEGKDWVSEFRMVMPDGAIKHLHVVARVAAWEQGNREYIGAIRDVTAEKLAEERLRASERRYAVTLSSIGDGVIATDEDSRVTFLNPVAEALTGVANADALGQPIDDVFRVVSEHGHPTLVSRDGGRIPIDQRRSPIVHDGGDPSGVVIVFHDVTQRRRAEEATALQLANERLQLALRGSNVGIWHLTLRDQSIDDAVSHMVNMWESLGYDPDEETADEPLSHPDRWHPGDLREVRAAMNAHIRGETPEFALVARNVHKDGLHRWRINRGKALRDAAGRAVRFVGSSVDITDRKHLEEQLVHAKELAEAANQAKDDFLANVSHEIRTPMNAIFGMTELMLNEPMTEQQRSRLAIAKSAADNLLVIIDDLLDFSKIEAGKVELEAASFSLGAAVDECVQTLAVRARQQGLELRADIDEDVPDLLVGDAGRVRQVLINLVGNAVKFTVRGEVVVRIEVAEADPRRVAVRFVVRDTGIGIPIEKQALIFQAFTQQDTSTTRTYGGTGLGLTIAARLAAAMSGSITVDSAPGRGSTFTFTAWFARQPDAAPAVPAAPGSEPLVPSLPEGVVAPSSPLRVLVAEDNDFNAELMRQLLALRGHVAVIVGRGEEVLARIAESRFDLLLLDLHMPGLDGFQVIARIRAREQTSGEHLPVVALTARSRQEDRERCVASGMDDFMSKPIKAPALWAVIERFGRSPSPRALVDPRALLGACAADADILAQIVTSMHARLPREIARAEACLRGGDAATLREAAHSIRGMIATASTTAARLASRLEDEAALGQMAEATATLARLSTMAHELLAELSGASVGSLQLLLDEEP